MATEPGAPRSNRPRPWLLVLLGIAIVAYLGTQMFSGGTADTSVSSTPRSTPGGSPRGAPVNPEDLDVRIEALKGQEAPRVGGDRNPFRFQPKPPPLPPPPPPQVTPPVQPPVNTGPPPPPPIGNTVKFIGIVETGKVKIGAFSLFDQTTRQCTVTLPGREGEIIEGRYRVVRIGVESAVVEYVDGSGRATLPLNGQACVVR
jgi:hypothetical protein